MLLLLLLMVVVAAAVVVLLRIGSTPLEVSFKILWLLIRYIFWVLRCLPRTFNNNTNTRTHASTHTVSIVFIHKNFNRNVKCRKNQMISLIQAAQGRQWRDSEWILGTINFSSSSSSFTPNSILYDDGAMWNFGNDEWYVCYYATVGQFPFNRLFSPEKSQLHWTEM